MYISCEAKRVHPPHICSVQWFPQGFLRGAYSHYRQYLWKVWIILLTPVPAGHLQATYCVIFHLVVTQHGLIKGIVWPHYLRLWETESSRWNTRLYWSASASPKERITSSFLKTPVHWRHWHYLMFISHSFKEWHICEMDQN